MVSALRATASPYGARLRCFFAYFLDKGHARAAANLRPAAADHAVLAEVDFVPILGLNEAKSALGIETYHRAERLRSMELDLAAHFASVILQLPATNTHLYAHDPRERGRIR